MSIENSILHSLDRKQGYVFCISDMLMFGEYKAIAKAIERLEKKKIIERVISGVYYYPLFSETFGDKYPPNIKDIAKTLARSFGWNIIPSGITVLNQLGLSTQVPSGYVFLSSGPNRKYLIQNTPLIFKSAAQSNFFSCIKNSMVVQSLKAIGEENIDSAIITKLRNLLTNEEKASLLLEMRNAPIWMHRILKEIVSDNSDDIVCE